VAGVLALAAILTPAHAFGADCTPTLALAASAPELLKVVGSGAAQFPSGGAARPGDLVVGAGRNGTFICVTTVTPDLTEAHGWIAAAKLVQARAGGERWAGAWRTASGQSVVIRPRGVAGLSIAGAAVWGGADPARAAEGGVNTGTIAARATPHGRRLAFATGTGCAGRMWRLGPYLVAADNGRCGGMNVTFTGVYRRIAAAVAP